MDSDTISPQVDDDDVTAEGSAADSELEQASVIADHILASVIMWDDMANAGVSYALFVNLACYLTARGWTADQLAADAMWHSNQVADVMAQDDGEDA